MTSGAILSRTPSLGLAKLRFNFPNWGDEHNRNMELIDAALLSIGVAFDGAWDNDTSYPIGAKIIDPDDATFWRALVAHTSPSSGTFSEARAAEPTHWEEFINTINFRGEWADATAYQLNDIVFSGYKWAIVVATHTSATSFATGVADGNLEIFFDGTTTVTDAEAAASAAGTSETNASTFATNASNSASAAAQSVIDAAGEVAAALVHRNKAEQWAEEAEDVAVETGQFSAKHHRIKASVHESEAKDARDEAVNRLENAAGAVRHDIVQTLTSGEQQQARANIGLTGIGFFSRADWQAPVLAKTGAGTVSVKAGTIIEVDGEIYHYANPEPVTMPTLAGGDDLAVWILPDGTPVATLDHVSPPVAGARKIGGFHYAPGGNAPAFDSGGDTTPAINEFSIWDLKFRPSCPDPRGMALIAGSFWCDIYLLGVDHHINGTSRYNVTIADGTSPPKIPTLFGGNGSTAYSTLTWWEAAEVLQSHGKQLLSYAEFAAAMYGTKEAQSGGADPVSTILRADYTSIWGIMLATGNLWVWGRDFGGNYGAASYTANTNGRGSTHTLSNVARFGGSGDNGAESGSRTSRWDNLPTHSSDSIGARGRSDHMNHV